jgi:AcrR family transcriptional regulator
MSDGWVRRQERTRRDVFDAAGRLIANGGLEALTMRKLAEAAGVAVATLYNQFGDRDGVIVAFVSSGLDQLEIDLDTSPPAEPIDATRALFEAFDDTFVAEPEVWKPIFAALRSGSGPPGMGEVGDRVVQYIQDDFEKAATDGCFALDVDVERLARHVFVTRMSRVEMWAQGQIDWDWYRSSSRLGLELSLAAVLREPLRSVALERSGISRSDSDVTS